MTCSTSQSESPWPHRLAVVIVCATFPLVWLGGLVTTHQAGMAVPDWPNTYGYNLFLYPLSTWLAGPFDLLIEHGHRLLAATVGLLTIAFVVTVFRTSQQKLLRGLAIAALVGVCLQGALGGMRVILDARTLAMIHGCVGPTFFAFTVALAAMTSGYWRIGAEPTRSSYAGRLQRLASLTTLFAFVQLLLGAQLRHTPVDAGIGFFRVALYFHLLFAVALLVHAVLTTMCVVRSRVQMRLLELPAVSLALLVLLQLSLGAATWVVKYGWPAWLGEYTWTAGYTVQREDFVSSIIVTAHVAIGSLILATSLLVALRAFRLIKQDHVIEAKPVVRSVGPFAGLLLAEVSA